MALFVFVLKSLCAKEMRYLRIRYVIVLLIRTQRFHISIVMYVSVAQILPYRQYIQASIYITSLRCRQTQVREIDMAIQAVSTGQKQIQVALIHKNYPLFKTGRIIIANLC